MKPAAVGLFLFLTTFKVAFAQQTFIDSLRSRLNVTGLQLAWIDKDNASYYQSGSSFTTDLKKVNSTTIFQAASLSKVVLAYICMQLANSKSIDIDTPLVRYYKYPRIKGDAPSNTITARMVLNHTTGWPNWVVNPMQKAWGTSTLTTQFKPGTKWTYSGEGFVYLQLAIQSIVKKDLQQIASEMVFKPLGMKNSSFIWENRFEDSATYGHNNLNEPTERSEYFLPNAAFSLLTTATDYSIFLKKLVELQLDSLLKNEIDVFDKQKPDSNAQHLSWGLGLGIQHNELGKMAWHWGDNGDYKTFFIIHPKKKQLLVCFTNSINGLKLMKPLANYFFGQATWYAADWL